jgi:hypothetical protein
VIFSCIIPASKQDLESQKLKDLIASIKAQDFPQDQIEILVITEGDSEQAKAIGIKRAKGEICAMFCADNYLIRNDTFKIVSSIFEATDVSACYSRHYAVPNNDNSLNKYFGLIGNNDPIAFYLGKTDRLPFYELDEDIVFEILRFNGKVPSLGDNGFFWKSSYIKNSDLNNYYPMDNAVDVINSGGRNFCRITLPYLWHRTSDNLFTFLRKRYKYARDLYSDRNDRRWKIIDTAEDRWRLAWFCLATITVIPCLYTSIRGFCKIRDWAWFWHWPVCFGFLVTYTILALRNLIKHGRLFQCSQASLSQPLTEARA